ncbi:hypothetical protein H696_02027 [Fonticula alba]|uniref:DUF547 domain-containing protein n=1 Tax=Fonticula alba TaxID=691883 RepID=A0A058ZAY2_FONAL|nr:hypothetical protein H696_02027 [Fonticula alba]KCV71078.1 hypothetical protein H696_02027 [Fonticula alba]|eukprot:XP_009494201.1 hypothetical protein H696_02027 [Fonticula alba]
MPSKEHHRGLVLLAKALQTLVNSSLVDPASPDGAVSIASRISEREAYLQSMVPHMEALRPEMHAFLVRVSSSRPERMSQASTPALHPDHLGSDGVTPISEPGSAPGDASPDSESPVGARSSESLALDVDSIVDTVNDSDYIAALAWIAELIEEHHSNEAIRAVLEHEGALTAWDTLSAGAQSLLASTLSDSGSFSGSSSSLASGAPPSRGRSIPSSPSMSSIFGQASTLSSRSADSNVLNTLAGSFAFSEGDAGESTRCGVDISIDLVRRACGFIKDVYHFASYTDNHLDWSAVLSDSIDFNEWACDVAELAEIDISKITTQRHLISFWLNVYHCLCMHAHVAAAVTGNLDAAQTSPSYGQSSVSGSTLSLASSTAGSRASEDGPSAPASEAQIQHLSDGSVTNLAPAASSAHAVAGRSRGGLAPKAKRRRVLSTFSYQIGRQGTAGAGAYTLEDIVELLRGNPKGHFKRTDPRYPAVIMNYDPRVHFCYSLMTSISPQINVYTPDTVSQSILSSSAHFLLHNTKVDMARNKRKEYT